MRNTSLFALLAVLLPASVAAFDAGRALALQQAVRPSQAYRDLVTTLSGQNGRQAPRNLRELLPRLSPELRENFTLVYDSRSPHRSAVDPLHPRIVLFTPDARLLVALTGNPDKPGYDTVEAIHFDDERRAFFTSRFVLADAAARDPELAVLVRRNGELNRPECTRCHGGDPRPIFDSYNVWPGFYGSLADQPALHPEERKTYREFLATQKDREDLPYRLLSWSDTSLAYPYMDSDGETVHALERVEQLKLLPNTRLGMALTELNRARIARKLEASEKGDGLRLALLRGLAGCRELPIGPGFERKVTRLTKQENDDKLRRAGIDPGSRLGKALRMQELHPMLRRNLAEIAYLAGALGVGREDWSMAFEPGAFGFFDGILSGELGDRSYYLKEDFLLEMLREFSARDPRLAPYFVTYNPFSSVPYPFGNRLDLARLAASPDLCELLRRETDDSPLPPARLSWLDPSASPSEARRAPNPFRRCIGCHLPSDPRAVAPPIPFADLGRLRDALSNPAPSDRGSLRDALLARIRPDHPGRMPPGPRARPLSVSEQREIRCWMDPAEPRCARGMPED